MVLRLSHLKSWIQKDYIKEKQQIRLIRLKQLLLTLVMTLIVLIAFIFILGASLIYLKEIL